MVAGISGGLPGRNFWPRFLARVSWRDLQEGFVMAFETWLLFLAVSVIPVISPGPGVLFAITNALRYGVAVTILIGLINGAGIAARGLLGGLGLGALMQASAIGFLILKTVGAAYLIWLGVKIWRDRNAFAVEAEQSRKAAPLRRLSLQALAISLTHPKAMVATAALFPPFLAAASPALPQVVILAASYGGRCALHHVLIAFCGSWLRRFLQSPARVKWLRRATGGAFVGFGSLMAVAGRS
jgi:homoserine/homoserine lactone efflux protein